MNRLTQLLIIFSFLLSSAFAQDKCKMKKGNPECHKQEGMNRMPHEMGKILNFTKEQKAAFKSIKEATKQKMDLLEQQQSITVKEYNDRKTVIRKEAKIKRESLLTKEQMEKVASFKKEQESKKKEMFEKRLENMSITLALTDEQIKQIRMLHEKSKMEAEKIRNNEKWNDQEKRMQMKVLKKNNEAYRNKILTEEQRNKAAQIRKLKNENQQDGHN